MIYDLIDLICKKIVLCNYNSKLFKYAMKSIKSKKKVFIRLFLVVTFSPYSFTKFLYLFTKLL